MIIGTGVDIVNNARIERILRDNRERFLNRILSEEELSFFSNKNKEIKISKIAGIFASKEALSKAYGTGIGHWLSFKDIVIKNDEMGKPFIKCSKIKERIHLSISHEREFTIAFIIIEK